MKRLAVLEVLPINTGTSTHMDILEEPTTGRTKIQLFVTKSCRYVIKKALTLFKKNITCYSKMQSLKILEEYQKVKSDATGRAGFVKTKE